MEEYIFLKQKDMSIVTVHCSDESIPIQKTGELMCRLQVACASGFKCLAFLVCNFYRIECPCPFLLSIS